jgi:hypothetical protein
MWRKLKQHRKYVSGKENGIEINMEETKTTKKLCEVVVRRLVQK